MAEETGDRPLTHLHRAYREFLRMKPDPLTPRSLAALMRIEIDSAYDYVARLKSCGVIRPTLHCNPKRPEYELVPGTAGPPADRRGKRNPKASRPPTITSGGLAQAARRLHQIR